MEPLTSFGLGILAGFFLLAFVVWLKDAIYDRKQRNELNREIALSEIAKRIYFKDARILVNSDAKDATNMVSLLKETVILKLIAYLNVYYDRDKKEFVQRPPKDRRIILRSPIPYKAGKPARKKAVKK